MAKKISVAGNKETTVDLLNGLYNAGYNVDLLITLRPDQKTARKGLIAGYSDLRAFAEERDIKVYHPSRYDLQSPDDKNFLSNENLDVLLVQGWQRLIPEWFLDTLSLGAYGMHGSADPLPKGRGRSPMNHAIIDGRDRFFTHLFKYLPGVDDGDIVAWQEFDILPTDTIAQLHWKNCVSMRRLVIDALPKILDGTLQTVPQNPNIEPSYLPKRTPRDGAIDWSKSAASLENLVRAVTHPFPGAYTYSSEGKVTVWGGSIFDKKITYDEPPGVVVETFPDGSYVVNSGDYGFIVTSSDGADSIKLGQQFYDYKRTLDAFDNEA